MIKILFHIDTLCGGGAEKVLCNLVNNMDQSKFDITVQTLFYEEYKQYLVGGIKYKAIYPGDKKIYKYMYRLEAALGLVYRLHMKDDYNIEIAYLEFGPTKVIASSTNKKSKKIAWVHCDFEIAIKNKEVFIHKALTQYKKYNEIVCVSEKCKESFVSMFGNEPEVTVVYNTIDENEVIEKSKQQIPFEINKRKFTLCVVGRFFPQKNYFRLLMTVLRLHREGFDFDLWVLGDGQQREQIEKFIKDNCMSGYVFLFGFQNNPYPIINVADMLVCSSDYEGFSTFISEGIILGKPIVTTDCSGMRDLLGNNEYGIITENSDESFYLGLKEFLSNPGLITYYAKMARKRGNDFRLHKLVDDTEKFFIELLEKEKKGN